MNEKNGGKWKCEDWPTAVKCGASRQIPLPLSTDAQCMLNVC